MVDIESLIKLIDAGISLLSRTMTNKCRRGRIIIRLPSGVYADCSCDNVEVDELGTTHTIQGKGCTCVIYLDPDPYMNIFEVRKRSGGRR